MRSSKIQKRKWISRWANSIWRRTLRIVFQCLIEHVFNLSHWEYLSSGKSIENGLYIADRCVRVIPQHWVVQWLLLVNFPMQRFFTFLAIVSVLSLFCPCFCESWVLHEKNFTCFSYPLGVTIGLLNLYGF